MKRLALLLVMVSSSAFANWSTNPNGYIQSSNSDVILKEDHEGNYTFYIDSGIFCGNSYYKTNMTYRLDNYIVPAEGECVGDVIKMIRYKAEYEHQGVALLIDKLKKQNSIIINGKVISAKGFTNSLKKLNQIAELLRD